MLDPTEKWIIADILLEAAESDTLIETCIEKYPPHHDLTQDEMKARVVEGLQTISKVIATFL